MRRRRVWLGLLGLVVLSALVWWWWVPRAASEAATEELKRVGPAPQALAQKNSAQDAGAASVERALADGVFEVHVTAGGAPAPGVQVWASKQKATSPAYRPTWEPPLTQRTDARGVAELPASTGSWVLSAVSEGFATTTLDVVKPEGERVTVVRVSLERGLELRGVALDAKQVAIAPATIRATPLGDRSSRRRSSPAGVVETTVDARGAFQFSALAAGWWRLEGEAEGAGRADPLLINLPTGELAKLRFRRSGFLEGVVLQPDGGGAANALVVVVGPEGTDSLEASATGTFSTERMPGAYRLSARSAQLDGLVGSAAEVALVRAGATSRTRIVLSGSGGTLHGTVKRDDGAPVAGGLVIVSPHNEDGVCAQAITGPEGAWSLGGFPRGTYDLEAEAPGLMRVVESGFFVADGATVRADLVLGRLGRVKGTVESSTGAPLRVRVALRSLRGSFPDRQAVADGAGHFAFEDVAPGPAFVRVTPAVEELSRGVDLAVQPGATSEVKLVEEELVSLEVELDRTRCAPPADVTLVVMDPGTSQKRLQRLVPAASPRVTFQLSPGRWQLFSNDLACMLTERVKLINLEAGSKPPPLRLMLGPSAPTFDVTVLEADGHPAPFASATVRDEKGGLGFSSADAEGVVNLAFPSGEVLSVTASKQGRSAQVRGVQRSLGRVTLTLGPAARVHLRLEGASGMTRVSALLDGEFVDELRVSGAEGWIEEVPAGALTLLATSADATSEGKVNVKTSAGQTTEATLRLAPMGVVRGRVQLPAGTTSAIMLLISKTEALQAAIAADGTFSFGRILATDYTARVECPSCSTLLPKPVRLTPGATVELQVP